MPIARSSQRVAEPEQLGRLSARFYPFVDGLGHHFKFVPKFGQLAQMVTNLSFPAVFLGLAYLLLGQDFMVQTNG